jgi:hypothetical protein
MFSLTFCLRLNQNERHSIVSGVDPFNMTSLLAVILRIDRSYAAAGSMIQRIHVPFQPKKYAMETVLN